MEQKLIDAMSNLTDAITELNKKLSNIDVSYSVHETAVELKHGLQDLKTSVDNLNKTMLETE
jgi:hypothetical protein